MTEYQGFGRYRAVCSARATDGDVLKAGQDGGTTTALLCYALETGAIDGAVLTKKGSADWTPEQHVATKRQEIIESAGSVYSLSPSLVRLKDAVREHGLTKVAYVGLPCQIDALRKAQLYPFGARYVGDKIAFAIGIFCSENFHHEGLRMITEGLGNTPLEEVRKMHIAGGKFLVEGPEPVGVPVKQASRYAQDGDRVCPDLVAEYADISVGSIGSEPGWNTVFVRTRRGESILEHAKTDGTIEVKETAGPGLKLLEKLSLAKKKRAKETIEKRQQMGLFVTRDQYY
ncbi:MAG TPA: Coenzyme F420 hydrogenase/dehydrogenase, beta subunit C-terminal domain [Methanocella sp.]|jgi:coenzyme F420 hydrogenase subunit beta